MSFTASPISSRPGLTVHVDRVGQPGAGSVAARLLDCSRAEVQLGVADDLPLGESVVVRLRDEASRLQLDVAGAIQWRRHMADGVWQVGCRFAHELDWETLGELFLCGILQATPERADDRVTR